MSKNKPKETIEYVVRLQDKEREILDSVSTAYSLNRVMTPIVDLMKDNTALLLVAGLLAMLLPNLPPGWREELGIDEEAGAIAKIKDYLELQNIAGGVMGGWAGAWAGAPAGPWGALIGGIFGVFSGIVAVEVGETAGQALQKEIDSAKTGNLMSLSVSLMYLILMLERIGNRETRL